MNWGVQPPNPPDNSNPELKMTQKSESASASDLVASCLRNLTPQHGTYSDLGVWFLVGQFTATDFAACRKLWPMLIG